MADRLKICLLPKAAHKSSLPLHSVRQKPTVINYLLPSVLTDGDKEKREKEKKEREEKEKKREIKKKKNHH
ncbi:hypothetical protein CLV60_102288 [Dyadobacter jiangsuensis]|uniref:Uncharacterized protein n=1 Tax=Dyadobacter jiangsuensis TaxID=1591085 RepID=A0A2P8GF76_9BACT|nr:hypothetical protein CLV60_102288 [Dyadobacter jiangsuensis]